MTVKLRPGHNWNVYYQQGDDPAVLQIAVIGLVSVDAAAEQARAIIRGDDDLAGDFNIVAVVRWDFEKLTGRK